MGQWETWRRVVTPWQCTLTSDFQPLGVRNKFLCFIRHSVYESEQIKTEALASIKKKAKMRNKGDCINY